MEQPKLNDYKMVEVEWWDAVSDSCWETIDYIKQKESEHCRTIGFLLEETETEYKLTHTISTSNNAMGYIVIPKRFAFGKRTI